MSTSPSELNYVGENCNNNAVNAYYVGLHAISKNQYEKMIKDYFAGAYPSEHLFDASELDVSGTDYDCNDYIEFSGDSITNNADVTVSPVQSETFTGKYSIHLFRGLKYFFNPTRYEFSKAIGGMGKTMALRVIAKNNQGQDVVVYYGDLTNMYP